MSTQQNTTALTGETALVTGGTKGIGKAIADRLAQAGATVIVTARNKPDASFEHDFIAADLLDAKDVARLAQTVKERVGTLDILIDNIGGLTTPGGGFSTLTDEHWEQELQFNLLAAIRLDRALLPGMLEKKSGVVIHISTGTSLYPLWDINAAYAVSKAALNAYSKTLANEVTGKGVRVVTVSPGAVHTEMMENFIQGYAKDSGITPKAAEENLLSKFGGVPMGRMAQPEEIANLVAFVASPAASYITGVNYRVDGGAIPVVI